MVNMRNYNRIWPQYAFHMAGLENALSILDHGYIFSRKKAKELDAMVSDNASGDVIGHTDAQVKKYARFYFRPKTPTYYHMEGYHQEGLRYNKEQCVNITVPVLFVFDLETLLCDPKTVFNGTNASGHGFNPQRGMEAFASLHFDKIYNERSSDRNVILNYRHAEVLYPEMYPIAKSLKMIVCRNRWDMITLKTELKKRNMPEVALWESFIKDDESLFGRDESMFNRTGLRLEYISQNRSKIEDDVIQLEFSLQGQASYYEYIRRNIAGATTLKDYPPLRVIFDVQILGSSYHHELSGKVILTKSDTLTGLDTIPQCARKLILQIFFDEKTPNNLAFSGIIPLPSHVKRYRLILNAKNSMHLFPAGMYGGNTGPWETLARTNERE